MQIKRSQLKSIIKECLLEILQEGIGDALQETRKVSGPRNRDLEPLPGSRRNTLTEQPTRQRRSNSLDERAVPTRTPAPQIPQELSRDPVMAAIFADTAVSTLAQQGGNHMMPMDAAGRAAAAIDPVDMFGEDKIDSWNRAAFAPARPGIPSVDGSLMNSLFKDE